MHQSFVATAPPPHTYRDGRGIAGLMCRAVTFRVPPQCWACDITQMYPRGIYYYKQQGYTLSRPRSAGLLAGLLWMKSCCPRYSPWGGGGGGGSGYKWLVHNTRINEICHIHVKLDKYIAINFAKPLFLSFSLSLSYNWRYLHFNSVMWPIRKCLNLHQVWWFRHVDFIVSVFCILHELQNV